MSQIETLLVPNISNTVRSVRCGGVITGGVKSILEGQHPIYLCSVVAVATQQVTMLEFR